MIFNELLSLLISQVNQDLENVNIKVVNYPGDKIVYILFRVIVREI